MNCTPSVLVHGPKGCGKTRNGKAIAAALKLTRIVDEWQPGDRYPEFGALVLTADATDATLRRMRIQTMTFDEAMKCVHDAKAAS